MSDETPARATTGERVWVTLNHVKADQRELHEQFVHDILRPAAEQVDPTTVRKVRFLHPTEQNEDGTYTYIFLMDPFVEGADYSIDNLLNQVYGDAKGQEYFQMWLDSLAEEQHGYEVIQSPW
jgi:hypothetical protein